MEFSLILVPAVRDGEMEPFDNLIEQIELAEELGYDEVWLTEHHFSQYGRAAVPPWRLKPSRGHLAFALALRSLFYHFTIRCALLRIGLH